MWMYLWQLLSDESCDAAVTTAIAYCTELGIQRIMLQIAQHRAGHRPGRLEPRIVRKRPQPKMKKARSAYHRRAAVTIIEPEYF